MVTGTEAPPENRRHDDKDQPVDSRNQARQDGCAREILLVHRSRFESGLSHTRCPRRSRIVPLEEFSVPTPQASGPTYYYMTFRGGTSHTHSLVFGVCTGSGSPFL